MNKPNGQPQPQPQQRINLIQLSPDDTTLGIAGGGVVVTRNADTGMLELRLALSVGRVSPIAGLVMHQIQLSHVLFQVHSSAIIAAVEHNESQQSILTSPTNG